MAAPLVHNESYVTLMLSKEPLIAPHVALLQSLVETVESLKGESSNLPPKLDVPVSVEEPNQETKSVSNKVPSQG